MHGRNFNGSSDFITVDPTGWNGLTGDMTIAAVVYRATTANMNLFKADGTGGSTGDNGMYIDTGTLLIFSASTGFLSTTTVGVGTWFLCVTKASGTSTPRIHLFSYDTRTWTHENEGGAVPSFSSTGVTNLYVGQHNSGSDKFNGDMFAGGAWAYNASDAEVEGLVYNLGNWYQLPNLRMFLVFDQPAAANGVLALDNVGAAQTGVTGTSVGTREAPIGFARAGLSPIIDPAKQSTATATNASAGVATGTGTAYNPAPSVAPAAGVAAGSGAAYGATIKVSPSAGVAAGTGAANGVTIQAATTAGAATGTGAALAPAPSVAPVAGVAAGTGTAHDPTVVTGSFTNASAGLASGSGTAYNPSPSAAANTGAASGTGAATGAQDAIAPTAGVAAGTGAAFDVTILIGAAAVVATAVAVAYAASTKASPTAGNATGTGAAYNPTADNGSTIVLTGALLTYREPRTITYDDPTSPTYREPSTIRGGP